MVFNYKHYIRNSNLLGEYTLNELQNVLEKYPFFQLARILYLKNLHVLKKPEFEVELKKSVIYIYNRAFLHDFLFAESKNKQVYQEEPSRDAISTETKETGNETTIDSPQKIKTEQTAVETDNDINDISEDEIVEKGSIKKEFADSLKTNIADLLDKQLIEAEKKSEEKDLDLNQVQIDIEKTYAKDLEKVSNKQDVFVLLDDIQDENKNLKTPEEAIDQKRISETVSYAKDLLEFDYVLKNVVKYNLKEEDNQNFNAESSPGKSFTEWLDSFNKSGVGEKTKPVPVEDNTKEEQVSDKEDKAEIKNQIIDNFIQTNPAIRPEDKPFEYEDISTHSVKEDDNLVTDTLARIYYNQARYDKALEAYEKLSLKYPEKNSYFATQIEKIKNKLNDLK